MFNCRENSCSQTGQALPYRGNTGQVGGGATAGKVPQESNEYMNWEAEGALGLRPSSDTSYGTCWAALMSWEEPSPHPDCSPFWLSQTSHSSSGDAREQSLYSCTLPHTLLPCPPCCNPQAPEQPPCSTSALNSQGHTAGRDPRFDCLQCLSTILCAPNVLVTPWTKVRA